MKQRETLTEPKGTILWVDDEIELLRPHILFLEDKAYDVETASNGDDALELVRHQLFDIILLDEMMPGMGGLKVLAEIKSLRPGIPVVMVTKNEAESLMEEAIGDKISDYLTKPVNPSQVLLTIKKILEGKKITSEHLQSDYVREFNRISASLSTGLLANEWLELYTKLTRWAIDFDEHPELGLRQTLNDQFREANMEFGKCIDRNYTKWVSSTPDKRPTFSTDIVDKYLIPELQKDKSVFFFVIDCMRLDQWFVFEEILREYFTVKRDAYFSILPTATPYSRNAIFSGSFPDEIEKRYPEIWAKWEDDENSLNKFEKEMLDKLLERRKIAMKPEQKYIKILDGGYGRGIEQNILSYTANRLTSVVVNFVDMLAHGRSDSPLLKEIAPDESAYRLLTKTWFLYSSLFGMLKSLAEQKNVSIIITTDHGSIRCLRSAKVIGDKEAASNLRYKYGRNLKCDEKNCIFIKNPTDYRLPKRGAAINYIIAKEDYYFVYPTDFHHYVTQYRDTFQHGGVSLEEMILPIATLEPK
ncbi:MAG: bifunctional response regulator/alkaline phosphatase family protein [Ignavibacteria bacterium]|nr:bifunctional response regulator/alkaline phosphatase family protein [Ignavibacteria bacterium]